MSLDPAAPQRIRTFVAAIEPRFDDITRSFFDQFEKSCPAASALRPARSKRARFAFAAAVAMVIKNIDNLSAARAVFEHMTRQWQRAGLHQDDLRLAQSCLVNVLRNTCADHWSAQVESEASIVIAEAFSHVQLADRQAARDAIRKAA